MTAHGIYQFYVNGVRYDNREFAPENTSYHKLLQYQTYDITPLLQMGKNVFGIIIGDGWWCGRVGTTGDSCQYGNKLGLLFESVITYHDGSKQIITGSQGKSMSGPIIFSDLFVGEKYDARKELSGWLKTDYDDSNWDEVKEVDYPIDNLVGQSSEPVRIINSFKPKELLKHQLTKQLLMLVKLLLDLLNFH
ncbi:alpha-L-rhamnosidase N-terminal domain-containing protein [Coprobacillaceae bacterium CR2/5/TPMF4]|nr:alpha-L-rhamnosidase N-terminal domain-containing protein [Coprobacillaceae bacterium CR2/5/TPMF4]